MRENELQNNWQPTFFPLVLCNFVLTMSGNSCFTTSTSLSDALNEWPFPYVGDFSLKMLGNKYQEGVFLLTLQGVKIGS